MEFKDFFVTFIIIGLFIFAFASFSISLSSENNAEVNLNQSPALSKMATNINNELETNASNNANSANKGFTQETNDPTSVNLGFVFRSILSAGTSFISSGINMITYIFEFANETLQIPKLITGTILAIITGLMILAIWSVVRAGR